MDAKPPGKIINELKPGKFANLGKITPSGSLEARKLSNGLVLYWRVTLNGKSERVAIGNYDSSAPPKSLQPTAKGFSVQAAIRAAEVLAQKHHANLKAGGYAALVVAEAEAKIKAGAAQETERKLRLEAGKHTFKSLLDHYCDDQKNLGRTSHKDARSIFKRHIFDAWPKVAALPANEVTGEQIADMMRRTLELGHGRTANKLRSYVRAAYQRGRAARSKATIPVAFKLFNITHNPASDTEPDESANKADKDPLSTAELRSYWQRIKALQGRKGAVLRLHLLSGGQRIEQLLNLKTADVTSDAILLYDGKGRPGKAPRPHIVPLISNAAAALLECKPQGTYAISTDGGLTHLSASTFSTWAFDAAVNIQRFEAKRIRSGVETLLASARISTEIRGRLQSHGISGVQARHYDGHSYMDEKRNALEALFTLLEAPETSNVVPIRAA